MSAGWGTGARIHETRCSLRLGAFGLSKELTEVTTMLTKVKTEAVRKLESATIDDDALETVTFFAGNAGRLANRMKAIVGKASESFLKQHEEALEQLKIMLGQVVSMYRNTKGECAYSLFKSSGLKFIEVALSSRTVEAKFTQQILETLTSRAMTRALVRPSRALAMLLTSEELKEEDALYDSLLLLCAGMINIVHGARLINETTLSVPNLLSDHWKEVLRLLCCELKIVAAPGQSCKIPGTVDSVLIEDSVLIRAGIVKAFKEYTGQLFAKHGWFKKVCAQQGKQIVAPAHAIDNDSLVTLEASLQHISSIVQLLEPSCLPELGIAQLSLLLQTALVLEAKQGMSDVLKISGKSTDMKFVRKKKAIAASQYMKVAARARDAAKLCDDTQYLLAALELEVEIAMKHFESVYRACIAEAGVSAQATEKIAKKPELDFGDLIDSYAEKKDAVLEKAQASPFLLVTPLGGLYLPLIAPGGTPNNMPEAIFFWGGGWGWGGRGIWG